MKDGHYITMRIGDTAENRDSAEQHLREQGCKSVRFAMLADGRMQCHGYLSQMECAKCYQPAARFVGMWCEACAS